MEQLKIVCFGDSNTYAYDPRSYFGERFPVEDRWVSILSEEMGCTVVNAGENGREIPRHSWELEEFQQMLAEEVPIDLLIVMLGTNDLLQGNSAADVAGRMEAFLGQTDLDLCGVLLVAPPILRLGEWVPSDELVLASRELNKAYRELALRLDVRFADAGEWNLSLAFDGVHLNREGHRIFAEELFRYLKKGE